MKRRQFIGASAAATVALSQPKWLHALDANNKYRKDIGIQLYTLRNEIKKDVAGTLKAVADAGYKQVEPYGFPNADEMIREAKANGMAVNSSHMDTASILSPEKKGTQPLTEILQKAKDLGLSHLVIPWLGEKDRDSLDKYKLLVEKFNAAAEVAKTAGIQLSYHNHAFEFKPFEGGKSGYDIMMSDFSDNMLFEVDVFWVQVAGHDAAELLSKLSGRVSQVHLKDLDASVKTPTFDHVPNEAFKELGNGVIEMEPIIAAAEKAGVAHCHVEQDQSPHPLKSVQQSMAFLKSL